MPAWKALLIFLVIALVGATGLFLLVPSSRPGPVKDWFFKAQGFTPATSANDALDKFKLAIEKRNFEAASRYYLSGDYKEWFEKAQKESEPLARTLDDLRAAMKSYGVKSDKGNFAFFMLEPIPPDFKFNVTGSGDSVTALLDWKDALAPHSSYSLNDLPRNMNLIWHSLLPSIVVGANPTLAVTVAKEKDGFWRIQVPVALGDRHVRDTVDYLRKNGSNFRNGLANLKNDVKNNAPTKQDFDASLARYLEESR